MLIFYNIAIYLYYFVVNIASLVNKKALAWAKGRKHQQIARAENSIWFHFASLGEFEQGRPVLDAARKQYPQYPIVITFFSPSGYQIRKNTPLANAVYYLPLDTAANAREFIATINPKVAIFTKYEYWYHYFNELHARQIPLYMISAIFRPQQIFFKWYGNLHRQMLTKVTRFFVQDAASQQLLGSLNISNVIANGDTRFDRVYANAGAPKHLPLIESFKNHKNVVVAGSTWPPDEELIAPLVSQYPDWKFIIAPHEIEPAKIETLLSLLPTQQTICFSQITNVEQISQYQVLIIDNIGMLSSLYQYGELAFIGGGFGAGIHNTLEAAAFGLPVIFGPNYQKFKEAKDLVALNAGFSVANAQELSIIAQRLITDSTYRKNAGFAAKNFVDRSKGATAVIMQHVKIA